MQRSPYQQGTCPVVWVVLAVSLALAPIRVIAAPVTITVFNAQAEGSGNMAVPVSEFEQYYPDIKVEVIGGGSCSTADEKIAALLASATKVDVLHGNCVAQFPRLARAGWLLDLSPFVTRDKDQLSRLDLLPQVVQTYTMGGQLYALQMQWAAPVSLRTNADMWNEAGLPLPPVRWDDSSWSWETMVTAARKMTKLNPDGSFARSGLDLWGNFQMTAYAFGGDFYAPESYRSALVTAVSLDTPPNVRALEAYRALHMEFGVSSPIGQVAGQSTRDAFYAGNIAMMAGSGVGESKNSPFSHTVAPFPTATGRPLERAWGYGDGIAIPRDSKSASAAWEWIKFTLKGNPEDPDRRSSVRRDTWLRWPERVVQENPMAITALQLREYLMTAVPITITWPQRTILGANLVDKAVDGKLKDVRIGNLAPAAALKQAQAEAEAAIRQLTDQLTSK